MNFFLTARSTRTFGEDYELWGYPILRHTHFSKILARNLARFAVIFLPPIHLMHFSAGVMVAISSFWLLLRRTPIQADLSTVE